MRGYRANSLINDDWSEISPEIFKEVMDRFSKISDKETCVSGAGGRDTADLKSATKIQRGFESHLTH